MERKTIALYITIVLATAAFVGCGGGSNTKSEDPTTAAVAAETENVTDPIAEISITETETQKETEPSYSDVQSINDFINTYNSFAMYPMVEYEEGNIGEKMFCITDQETRIELLDSRTNGFYVSFEGTASDAEEIRKIFGDVVKTLDADIADGEIETAFDDLVSSDVLVENYEFGSGFTCSYVPNSLYQPEKILKFDIRYQKQ